MDQCIERYIKQIITRLICSEEEKGEIEDEMRDHLYLLVQEYSEEGYSEKEAVEKALQTFGDEKEIEEGFQKSLSPFHKLIQYTLWISFSLYTLVLLLELFVGRLIKSINMDYSPYFFHLGYHTVSPYMIFNKEIFYLNTNFVPFGNIYMYATGQDRFNLDIIIHNTIGNVLIFVPLGIFFLLLLSKKPTIMKAALFFIKCSVVIEILQYVLRVGQFDIDDVILNTIGGIVGYFIIKLIKQGLYFSKKNISKDMQLNK